MSSDVALAAQDEVLDHIPAELVLGRYCLRVPEESTSEHESWAAEHLLLGRIVSLRFARPGSDPRDALARFRAEAAMVSALLGVTPHVLPVLDADAAPNGTFLVAERRGDALAERLGVTDIQRALRRLEAIADVIRSAAKLGIVHCDLRLETIRVEGTGDAERVFVGGFHAARPAMSLPSQGALRAEDRASVGFLSPEQILGESADPAIDRWAFAAIAFAVLTGRCPFAGTIPAQTLLGILARPHLRATELRRDLPRGIDAWFDRALAKDPARRFATIDEMVHGLRALLAPAKSAWNPAPSPGRLRLALTALGVVVALGVVPGAAAPERAGASVVPEQAPREMLADTALRAEETSVEPAPFELPPSPAVCKAPEPSPRMDAPAPAAPPKPVAKARARRAPLHAAVVARRDPSPGDESVDKSAIH